MSFFGLGRPNLQQLKASGDADGIARSLEHKDERVRAQALDVLIDLATDAAMRQHNLVALTALKRSARDQAVRRLKEILKDIHPIEESWRNAAVAEALIGLGAADAVLAYYDAHASGDHGSGLFILDILGLLTRYAMARRDSALLKKLLQSGQFDYREVLSGRNFCFAHLAHEMVKPLYEAADVLAEIGSEDDLIALGQQARSDSARQWAWSALGKVGSAKCLPALIQAAETGAQHGEWALAGLIPRLSADDLDRLARHPQARVRNPALLQLCERSDPSTFETILSAASSETADVSVAAIEALGRMRRKEAVATLSAQLQRPSVWRTAAAALGAIGDESGLSSLLALSSEKLVDDVVLKAIAEGGAARRLLEVLKLRPDQLSPEETLKLIVALRKSLAASDLAELQDTFARPYAEALDDPGWAKRRAAITALAQIGGSVATRALEARHGLERDYELSKQIEEALIEAQRSCG